MAAHENSTRDLKQRVITCLNKLSDRDTLAVATTELEAIARNLTQESFSPFIACIYATDSSERSPVRRQCVRLLGVLSQTHGDALSPFLSKMLAAVVRRLRDPDSAVRSACVDAVATMSLQITKPPFSSFLKPLSEAVLLEQDYNSQIGSALCLAAAIDTSPCPEPAHLAKLLPRLLKLVKSDSFKAKPALLSLIGSVVGAGGVLSRNVLDGLVPCLVENLSSEDWAARKAAAEALGKAAALERDLVAELRSTCLTSLESRRFDKVKAVRETMNRTLELWKEVFADSDEASSPSQSKFTSKDNSSGGCSPPVSKSPRGYGLVTPQRMKTSPTTRSPSSINSSAITTIRSTLKSNDKKLSTNMFHKMDHKRSSGWKIEIAVPHSPDTNLTYENDLKRSFGVSELGDNRSGGNLRPETKRALFNKVSDDKAYKFSGLRSGSRVVPFHGKDNSDSNCTEEFDVDNKDIEDLSLIRKQLVEIENRQSSLLDLLQRLIGSSQSGMNSLETRVNGLEMALDEISYDLAVSTGRISSTDSAGNTCCKLPGAEFLSSKFWRRTEGRYPTSRFSSSGSIHSPTTIRNMPDKDSSNENSNLDCQRFEHQNAYGFVVNHLADICSGSRGNAVLNSNRTKSITRDAEWVQVCCDSSFDGASPVTHTAAVNFGNRSSA